MVEVHCSCSPPWPELVARLPEGDVASVVSLTPGPVCALYDAWCKACGARYTGLWRLPPGEPVRPQYGPEPEPEGYRRPLF